jgi:hypothetical protein
MGADFIGWRDCRLQAGLGPEGFLGKLKLRSYQDVIEERVPEDRWETVSVVVRVTGRPERQLTYGEICKEIEAFGQGIPECATCPLAGGKPLGCYRYVTYPVDAIAERLLFEFFVAGVEVPDSIADQLFRDIVSRVDEEAGWYGSRGEDGGLAELEEPLEHTWGSGPDEQRIDSAQMLAALFISLDDLALVVAYARFWLEFFQFVDRKLEGAGVKVDGDVLEIHVDGGHRPDPERIAEQAVGSLALATEIAQSGTLTELRHVAELLAASLAGAVEEGWTIVVDG